MPNYHLAQESISKLEEMKHTLSPALEKMANRLIEDFDEHGYMSDFGLDTVNQLLERKR